jgi:hypothetical protein
MDMKVRQSILLSTHQEQEIVRLGRILVRSRHARRMKQADTTIRAGISRNTAYRIEKFAPGLAIGQVLRYLDAIAPGATLASLILESDPALISQGARESTQRTRARTAAELKELNF